MNRKRISAFFTIVMVLAVILSLSACDVQGLKKLDAPVVTVSETGLASWEAVEGAVGYKYKINIKNAYVIQVGINTFHEANEINL